jgi:hypothetical protein
VVQHPGREADPPSGGRQVHGLQRPDHDDDRTEERGRADDSRGLVSRQGRLTADRGVGFRGGGESGLVLQHRREPRQVRIEVEGHTVEVVADQLHGTEREEAWQQIIAASPRFAQYQCKTDRELPVLRLRPLSG